MPDTTTFNAAVQSVFNQAAASAGSVGLSWSSFGQYFDLLKVAAMEAAKEMAVAGYQKKQLVMDAIGVFIDAYLPLPAWLFFLRGTVKKVLLSLADGAIETLYKKIIDVVPVPVPTPAPTPSV